MITMRGVPFGLSMVISVMWSAHDDAVGWQKSLAFDETRALAAEASAMAGDVGEFARVLDFADVAPGIGYAHVRPPNPYSGCPLGQRTTVVGAVESRAAGRDGRSHTCVNLWNRADCDAAVCFQGACHATKEVPYSALN
jgi:hypothetical protein